ncbi:MAG: hypothetical protein ACM67S_00690, partial [Bacteroidota bacterium]
HRPLRHKADQRTFRKRCGCHRTKNPVTRQVGLRPRGGEEVDDTDRDIFIADPAENIAALALQTSFLRRGDYSCELFSH